jgi:hypothetical protein
VSYRTTGGGPSFFPLSGVAFNVHPALAALYQGLPANPVFAFVGNIRAAAGPTSLAEAFTLPVSFANLFIQPTADPIPEPATLLLVGAGGLIGAARSLRRRSGR